MEKLRLTFHYVALSVADAADAWYLWALTVIFCQYPWRFRVLLLAYVVAFLAAEWTWIPLRVLACVGVIQLSNLLQESLVSVRTLALLHVAAYISGNLPLASIAWFYTCMYAVHRMWWPAVDATGNIINADGNIKRCLLVFGAYVGQENFTLPMWLYLCRGNYRMAQLARFLRVCTGEQTVKIDLPAKTVQIDAGEGIISVSSTFSDEINHYGEIDEFGIPDVIFCT